MLPRETIQSLTYPGLACWTYLMSLPADWVPREMAIRKHFNIGQLIYRKMMRELREKGLVSIEIVRDETGKILSKTMIVRAIADPASGKSIEWETHAMENPSDGKPNDIHKTDLVQKTQEEKKTQKELSCDLPKPPESRFPDFWQAYPRKIAKTVAQRAWTKAKLDSLAEFILADITRRRLDDPSWSEIQYIPHPATYLNQRRWEDEIDTRAGRSPKKRVNSCGYSNWI